MEIKHDRNGSTLMIHQNRYIDDEVCRFNKDEVKAVTTKDYGIIYDGSASEVQATSYMDADWGSNIDDRRSVSGIMMMIGGAPDVFKSKDQRTVTLSSAEAEYMALSFCTQEVLRISGSDFGLRR
ncbi:unnamed protein product [Peronospora farinosa]|uniref:Uncharacterized protein n=1 Tax=Peronospora farinosa TaxID=134698 RepID=A0AAV0SSK1_9STRA|nr:unnamed protein product [Peronospora farinosa]